MADVTPNINQTRAMRIAVNRIEGFAKQFGELHRNLARHAAFPFVLTPDLLYQIRENFVPEAPLAAVDDVLLSRLCRQVGYEMYQMDIADRNLLLRELKEQFGQEQLNALGKFLLDYVARQLTGDDSDTQDLAEAQEWTALAYTKLTETAPKLVEALSLRVKQQNRTEIFRLTSLVETFAEPLVQSGFEPLLIYANGLKSFVRGNHTDAAEQLGKLFEGNDVVEIAGVNASIPPELQLTHKPQLTSNNEIFKGSEGKLKEEEQQANPEPDKKIDILAPEVRVTRQVMALRSETVGQLLGLLRPYLQDEGERKAYLFRALGMREVDRLNLTWKQPTNTFIPEMVKELLDYGEILPAKPALCAFLEVIREDVGGDVKARIDELLQQIQEALKQPENKYNQSLTWQCIRTLAGHSDTVSSVAISPDGKILASGSLDKTIKLWNLETGNLLATLVGHSSPVLSVAFSPIAQILASSSNLEVRDGCIKLWDVEPARLRQTLGSGLINLRVSSLAFSPDGQTLASGHAEAKIRLWQLNSGKLRQTLKGHGWDVNSLAFSFDGRFLVSGGLDGAIKIWNWRTGEEVRTLKRPPSSEWIGSLVSWFDSSVGSIWSVAVSPNRKTFASAGSQQPIELWDLETGKLLRILTEHSGTVYSVAFNADGKILASGGEDNTIKLWNVLTGELLETLEHLGPVKSVAFSPTGQTLVSGSADTTIKLWQIYER